MTDYNLLEPIEAWADESPFHVCRFNMDYLSEVSGAVLSLLSPDIWAGDEADKIDMLNKINVLYEQIVTPYTCPPTGGSGMEQLEDITLASDADNIELASIDQGYRDLFIRAYLRKSTAGVSFLRCNVNDDTGSNHHGWGFTTTTIAATSVDYFILSHLPVSTSPAGLYAVVEVTIPNYTDSNTKQVMWRALTSSTGAFGGVIGWRGGGYFDGTSTISKVTLYPQAGQFEAGSRVELWGVE